MKSSLKPKAIPHNNKQNISLIISFETRIETLLRGTLLHCKHILHYFLRSVQFYQQIIPWLHNRVPNQDRNSTRVCILKNANAIIIAASKFLLLLLPSNLFKNS